MRYAAGQLADRLHLLGMAQPVLLNLLLGDLAAGTAIAAKGAVSREDRAAADPNPPIRVDVGGALKAAKGLPRPQRQ